MSSRRAISVPVNLTEKPPKKRGRCTNCLCISWKILACILSHTMLIAIVVAYCWMGALAFHNLETEHEKHIKESIKKVRVNLTEELQKLTNKNDYLKEEEWIGNATICLHEFENKILDKMKNFGWDGDEDVNKSRWTITGALFYSIIVITTIGYGHISPKTQGGKIATIFYAIVGIPLMLLCLSNIGDIMASSFRFIYWRICCFVCTRDPRRRRQPRRPNLQRSASHAGKFANRSSIRRSIRMSQRTNDSTADSYYEPKLPQTYSDPDLRYTGTELNRIRPSNPRSQRFSRHRNRDRIYQGRHTVERDRGIDRFPRRHEGSVDRHQYPKTRTNSQKSRSHSVARETHRSNALETMPPQNYAMTLPASYGRHKSRHHGQLELEARAKSVDPRLLDSKDILCNRYAIDEMEREAEKAQRYSRARSMPRQHQRYSDIYTPIREIPQPRKYPSHDIIPREREEFEMPSRRYYHGNGMPRHLKPPPTEDELVESETPVKKIKRREKAPLPPSPRIMSPMGFTVHRQARIRQYDEESALGDENTDRTSDIPTQIRPVPIWLCVFLVVGYIIAGAILFHKWEGWTLLDSAYFCFITLTTIGFGDFVPAQNAQKDPRESIIYCSLYLLFGIALLAMSFNLVQEEVIANVKDIARQIGILKEEESDY